jgi:hypothetical protein
MQPGDAAGRASRARNANTTCLLLVLSADIVSRSTLFPLFIVAANKIACTFHTFVNNYDAVQRPPNFDANNTANGPPATGKELSIFLSPSARAAPF